MESPAKHWGANLLLEPCSDRLALQPVRCNFCDPGEEIDNVMQQATWLKRERAELLQVPWLKEGSERQIGSCRDQHQSDEITTGSRTGCGRPLAEHFAGTWRKCVQRSSRSIEYQKLPQEPHGSVGPERQRQIVSYVGVQTRV